MELTFGELRFDKKARDNIARVMDRTYIAGAGPEVEEYEKRWGKGFGYKNNIAMYSGTGADTVACKVLYELDKETSRGDEIIAPACAFIAVGSSILDAGFKPVFVDIERETLNINPKNIEEKITPRTRAIMAVHTMGKPCNMDYIMGAARAHNLHVIEDCCEAHGAEYKNKFVGHFGDMATFSSYIAHLICTDEGGMLSTNDNNIASLARSIRNHGRPDGTLYFNHVRLGGNYKMHDLEAAVGLAALDSFADTFNTRKDNLNYLLKNVDDLRDFAYFNLEEGNEIICPHAFSITLKDPSYDCKGLYDYFYNNPIIKILAKRNFGSMPTQHKAFEKRFSGVEHRLGEFPESEYVGDNGLHFGVNQYLTREHLDRAIEVLHNYFSKFR